MTERIIALRPHHIDRFVSYYYDRDLFDKPSPVSSQSIPESYGKRFAKKYQDLFDLLALGGTGEEYILVKNGLDDICFMCPIRRETCSDLDSLSVWNGSGQVMQDMDLREGWIYPIGEFLENVKQLYPSRNPNRR
jgi:hypothetical protein